MLPLIVERHRNRQPRATPFRVFDTPPPLRGGRDSYLPHQPIGA